MGTKKGGAEEAADKTLGWIGETAGRIQGDRTLEAEGRAARRMGERRTYFVSVHADGRWKIQAEGASRATRAFVIAVGPPNGSRSGRRTLGHPGP